MIIIITLLTELWSVMNNNLIFLNIVGLDVCYVDIHEFLHRVWTKTYIGSKYIDVIPGIFTTHIILHPHCIDFFACKTYKIGNKNDE